MTRPVLFIAAVALLSAFSMKAAAQKRQKELPLVALLNAYSISDFLSAKDNRDKQQVYTLFNLLDWCATFSNDIGFRAVFPGDKTPRLKDFSQDYKGWAWDDKPQQIPGKIQCEWYDLGGEGIAYHDKDSINNGSGKLNPANGSFMNEFRMKEGVDISYTKAKDIDNNPYNIVQPMMDQFYIGWTEPGEWINYTVTVNKTATYSISLMYTANGDGSIALLLDGKKLSRELIIPSTRNAKETIPWRQWHHWNRIDALASVQLKKGKHILTIQTVTNGNMNYDYLDFKLRK